MENYQFLMTVKCPAACFLRCFTQKSTAIFPANEIRDQAAETRNNGVWIQVFPPGT
jgi:hypothetical protein